MNDDQVVRNSVEQPAPTARAARVTTGRDERINSLPRSAFRSTTAWAPISPPLSTPNHLYSDRQHLLKLSVSRETFLARLGVAVRGVSTRSADPDARRRPPPGGGRRASSSRRPTWSSASASRSRRPSRARRPGGRARPAAARRGSFAAEGRPVARVPLAEQDVEVVSGPAKLPPAHAADRGLPEAARGAGRRRAHACRRRRSSRRSAAWRARPRATRRARTSPACSSPPAGTSCGWSPPTRTA